MACWPPGPSQRGPPQRAQADLLNLLRCLHRTGLGRRERAGGLKSCWRGGFQLLFARAAGCQPLVHSPTHLLPVLPGGTQWQQQIQASVLPPPPASASPPPAGSRRDSHGRQRLFSASDASSSSSLGTHPGSRGCTWTAFPPSGEFRRLRFPPGGAAGPGRPASPPARPSASSQWHKREAQGRGYWASQQESRPLY